MVDTLPATGIRGNGRFSVLPLFLFGIWSFS